METLEDFLRHTDCYIVDPVTQKSHPFILVLLKIRSRYFDRLLSKQWQTLKQNLDNQEEAKLPSFVSPCPLPESIVPTLTKFIFFGQTEIPLKFISELHNIAECWNIDCVLTKIEQNIPKLDDSEFTSLDFTWLFDRKHRFTEIILDRYVNLINKRNTYQYLYYPSSLFALFQFISSRLQIYKKPFVKRRWLFDCTTTFYSDLFTSNIYHFELIQGLKGVSCSLKVHANQESTFTCLIKNNHETLSTLEGKTILYGSSSSDTISLKIDGPFDYIKLTFSDIIKFNDIKFESDVLFESIYQ